MHTKMAGETSCLKERIENERAREDFGIDRRDRKLEGTHMGYWRNIFRDGFVHGIGECKKIIRSHMDEVDDD